ncbi:uncharacterized protein TNCV_3032871 [Trichonephila clavipes]|nr:uncharacterized protein TNCV_3032871 [Trichonephila clavipes]
MIASYVNDNHETWNHFLREFTFAIRTAVNEITGKAPAELFLGRKLIIPLQKEIDDNGISVGNSDSSDSRYQASSLRVCDLDQIGHKIVRIVVGQVNDERKKLRREETAIPEQNTGKYNLRPRKTERAESGPSSEQIKDHRVPVRSRGRRYQQYRPYYKDQGCKQQSTSQSRKETKRVRSRCQNSRSRGGQQK